MLIVDVGPLQRMQSECSPARIAENIIIENPTVDPKPLLAAECRINQEDIRFAKPVGIIDPNANLITWANDRTRTFPNILETERQWWANRKIQQIKATPCSDVKCGSLPAVSQDQLYIRLFSSPHVAEFFFHDMNVSAELRNCSLIRTDEQSSSCDPKPYGRKGEDASEASDPKVRVLAVDDNPAPNKKTKGDGLVGFAIGLSVCCIWWAIALIAKLTNAENDEKDRGTRW